MKLRNEQIITNLFSEKILRVFKCKKNALFFNQIFRISITILLNLSHFQPFFIFTYSILCIISQLANGFVSIATVLLDKLHYSSLLLIQLAYWFGYRFTPFDSVRSCKFGHSWNRRSQYVSQSCSPSLQLEGNVAFFSYFSWRKLRHVTHVWFRARRLDAALFFSLTDVHSQQKTSLWFSASLADEYT